MNFSKKELGFILYNNRSTKVVENFLPDNINPISILVIENLLKKAKSKFNKDSRMVKIPYSDLNLNENDVLVDKTEVNNLTNEFLSNIGKFNEREANYLKKRGINQNIIKKWNLLGLSNFNDDKKLETIGAKVHPILSNVLVDAIQGGGIVFPLFEDGVLQNCAIRKLSIENSDKPSLKYSLACPDVSLWKSKDIQPGDEIWLTEGLFDMFALDEIGLKASSCSSAVWSSFQLYKIILLRPGKINIFSDNDEVGLKTSCYLKDFFNMYGIDCEVYKSKFSKDASEHFFELKKSISDIELVDTSKIDIINDDSFDFLNYLKNRKY